MKTRIYLPSLILSSLLCTNIYASNGDPMEGGEKNPNPNPKRKAEATELRQPELGLEAKKPRPKQNPLSQGVGLADLYRLTYKGAVDEHEISLHDLKNKKNTYHTTLKQILEAQPHGLHDHIVKANKLWSNWTVNSLGYTCADQLFVGYDQMRRYNADKAKNGSIGILFYFILKQYSPADMPRLNAAFEKYCSVITEAITLDPAQAGRLMNISHVELKSDSAKNDLVKVLDAHGVLRDDFLNDPAIWKRGQPTPNLPTQVIPTPLAPPAPVNVAVAARPAAVQAPAGAVYAAAYAIPPGVGQVPPAPVVAAVPARPALPQAPAAAAHIAAQRAPAEVAYAPAYAAYATAYAIPPRVGQVLPAPVVAAVPARPALPQAPAAAAHLAAQRAPAGAVYAAAYAIPPAPLAPPAPGPALPVIPVIQSLEDVQQKILRDRISDPRTSDQDRLACKIRLASSLKDNPFSKKEAIQLYQEALNNPALSYQRCGIMLSLVDLYADSRPDLSTQYCMDLMKNAEIPPEFKMLAVYKLAVIKCQNPGEITTAIQLLFEAARSSYTDTRNRSDAIKRISDIANSATASEHNKRTAQEALNNIREKNPFPPVVGMVPPAPVVAAQPAMQQVPAAAAHLVAQRAPAMLDVNHPAIMRAFPQMMNQSMTLRLPIIPARCGWGADHYANQLTQQMIYAGKQFTLKYVQQMIAQVGDGKTDPREKWRFNPADLRNVTPAELDRYNEVLSEVKKDRELTEQERLRVTNTVLRFRKLHENNSDICHELMVCQPVRNYSVVFYAIKPNDLILHPESSDAFLDQRANIIFNSLESAWLAVKDNADLKRTFFKEAFADNIACLEAQASKINDWLKAKQSLFKTQSLDLLYGERTIQDNVFELANLLQEDAKRQSKAGLNLLKAANDQLRCETTLANIRNGDIKFPDNDIRSSQIELLESTLSTLKSSIALFEEAYDRELAATNKYQEMRNAVCAKLQGRKALDGVITAEGVDAILRDMLVWPIETQPKLDLQPVVDLLNGEDFI
jgi:hypothetical protein